MREPTREKAWAPLGLGLESGLWRLGIDREGESPEAVVSRPLLGQDDSNSCPYRA